MNLSESDLDVSEQWSCRNIAQDDAEYYAESI